MTFGLLVSVCFLLGALPFGFLVARLVRGIDVRRYGSGNTGMTNVLRTLGIWPALLVLALDAGKGILAVALAKAIDPTPSLEVAAALSALMGHIWSPFLGFRGGKGIATGIGALCALSPLTGLIVIVVNLPVVVYSRYISLGSILGSVTAPFAMLLLAILAPSLSLGAPSFIYLLYPSVATPMVVFKHRENILRLVRGQERKLGESVPVGESSMGASG